MVNSSKLRKVEGCPYTHLLAASRFSEPSRYLSGPMGVEFLAPSYEVLKTSKTFKITPIFDLKVDPWKQAKAHRFENGLWLLHPKNSKAGIGLFNFLKTAQESANLMRVPEMRIEISELGESIKMFLNPLWDSVNKMEDSFWEEEGIDHSRYQDTFREGLEVLRGIQSARTLIGVIRLRANHPYWST